MPKYASFTALRAVFNTLGVVPFHDQDIGGYNKKRTLYSPFAFSKKFYLSPTISDCNIKREADDCLPLLNRSRETPLWGFED